MEKFTLEQKKALRNKIDTMQKASGLTANAFSTEQLGFTNGSKFSHVLNGWDKSGLVGDDTWAVIEKYIALQDELAAESRAYKGVATKNLIKIWDTCERAYQLKQAPVIIGEGGYGKTFAFEKFKEKNEREGRYQVYYFDTSMTKTRKQFVAGLMAAIGCYKAGTIATQLAGIRAYMAKQDALLLVDEVSSLKGDNVTIIKDIMTALKDICGVVFAGSPYFLLNLNRGAHRDGHLYSETRDRLFMLPEKLEAPTGIEAEQIFRANGLTGDLLDIALGKNQNMVKYSYLGKKTYRGIADCLKMMQYVMSNQVELIKEGAIV